MSASVNHNDKRKSEEFYEWFWRFSSCGIKKLRKIVSRSQSTCDDSEFSLLSRDRMLPDVKIASALNNKIIQISQFKKMVSLEEQ